MLDLEKKMKSEDEYLRWRDIELLFQRIEYWIFVFWD